MQAFDLQDTLVHINYDRAFGHNGLIEQIAKASVIYRPKGAFIIITAQQDNSDIHDAISSMVAENFPNCERVHFVTGGTAQVADAKAAIIAEKNISDFTDNNREILAKIKEKNLNVKLWVMTKDGRKPY